MKLIITIIALFAFSASIQSQIIVDSATGAKIKGAKYIKLLNKYIVDADSTSFKKKNKNAKFQSLKIDTTTPQLLYSDTQSVWYLDNDALTNYVKENSFHYKAIKQGYTGKGIKVVIIDTGVDTLQVPATVAENSRWVTNGIINTRGKHGTNVGSVIRSKIGMANGCDMYYLKIFNTDVHGNPNGGIGAGALLGALNYADSIKADIVNISLSLGLTQLDKDALDSLKSHNTIVVAASGNNAPPTQYSMAFPAAYKSVIAVNGVKKDKDIAYSNVLNGQISVAIGGVLQQIVQPNNHLYPNPILISADFGTSLAAPAFCALLACKLEELRRSRADNYKVLNYVLANCVNGGNKLYFGNGFPIF